MSMPTGKVKFFNADRGYGFIQPDDGIADIFVHASAAERAGLAPLAEGQRIEFDIEISKRNGKPAAVNLRAAK
jgi:cold shock protein